MVLPYQTYHKRRPVSLEELVKQEDLSEANGLESIEDADEIENADELEKADEVERSDEIEGPDERRDLAQDSQVLDSGSHRPDTPKFSKHIVPMQDFELKTYRAAVLADIGSCIKELDVVDFIDDFIPPLDPMIDIEAVTATLKKERPSGSPILVDGIGWSAFCDTSPPATTTPDERKRRKRTLHEDKAYEPFEVIVNAIIDASPSTRKRCLKYIQRPTVSPLSAYRHYTGKPDGYGYLPSDEDTSSAGDSEGTKVKDHYWRQIVVCAEYKKSDTGTSDRNDNVAKLCGDMSQVMRDDPARRFTFGITVEKHRMRMWYCDRSDVVVSKPFSIMVGHEHLIRFILSIAYPLSLWEIGFDTTMRLVSVNDVYQYDIHVRDASGIVRKFRTIELLDYRGAEGLRGRGTRVWKAVQLEEGEPCGDPVAIKDVWIDSDRTREGYIMEKILADADAFQSAGSSIDSVPKSLREYFLPVLCHGDVMELGRNDVAESEGALDKTRVTSKEHDMFEVVATSRAVNRAADAAAHSTPRHGSPAGIPSHTSVRSSAKTASSRALAEEVKAAEAQFPIYVTYPQKTHYRIVFGDVGVPLANIDSLRNAFHALRHVSAALFLMHRVGWVHRDITPYNILLINDDVKLADLEYAKRYDDNTQHTLQTATDFFLSTEVKSRRWRFSATAADSSVAQTIPPCPSSQQARDVLEAMLLSQDDTTSSQETAQPESPFRYIWLHDLESVWWVGAWFLFYRIIRSAPQRDTRSGDVALRQRRYAVLMFETIVKRNQIISEARDAFRDYLDSLHPALKHAGLRIDDMRKSLINAYKEAEQATETIAIRGKDDAQKFGIHSRFIVLFLWLRDYSKEIFLEPHVSLPGTPAVTRNPHIIESGSSVSTATGITQEMDEASLDVRPGKRRKIIP